MFDIADFDLPFFSERSQLIIAGANYFLHFAINSTEGESERSVRGGRTRRFATLLLWFCIEPVIYS